MDELHWSAPEFEYHEKSGTWETTIIVVAILLIIGSLLFAQNFLFAAFVVIAAASLIFWGRRRPRTIEFSLNHDGLAIDGVLRYRYRDLASFAVSPEDALPGDLIELVFAKKGSLSFPVKVFAHANDFDNFREFLSMYLPEAEYEDSFADHLSRLIRF